MKRLWVALFLALALAGCRRSQQATNPFLRTTVPPPGTGAGAVVVPGDPYYPGATPPPVTGAPVATPMAPPPTAAPQAVVPPRELKRDPPGGDYFYHQSSVDGDGETDDIASADSGADDSAAEEDGLQEGGMELAINAAPGALRLGGESDAIEQAIELSGESAPADQVSFEEAGGRLPGEELPADTAVDGGLAAKPARRPIVAPRPVHTVGAEEADVDESELEEMPDGSSLGRAGRRSDLA